MSQSEKIILYQAYGSALIYRQALFSLLTLYYHLRGEFEGVKVVVYTDNPALFEKYSAAMPLSVEVLSREQIKVYKGAHNFVHRVKICILQDCFQKYGADILYVDSDTYFTQSPRPLLRKISSSSSIMNSDDYDLISADEIYENTDWLLIRRAIRNHQYLVDGKAVQIPLTTRMWNAGVIGMSVKNVPLLDQVLHLSDQIYANQPIFTAEQFAFSYVLQNSHTLVSSGDVVFHYWRDWGSKKWKSMYNYYLSDFFQRHRQAGVEKQAEEAFALASRHEHLTLPKEGLLKRVIRRLRLIAEVAVEGRRRLNNG